jgi:hypothetical protein
VKHSSSPHSLTTEWFPSCPAGCIHRSPSTLYAQQIAIVTLFLSRKLTEPRAGEQGELLHGVPLTYLDGGVSVGRSFGLLQFDNVKRFCFVLGAAFTAVGLTRWRTLALSRGMSVFACWLCGPVFDPTSLVIESRLRLQMPRIHASTVKARRATFTFSTRNSQVMAFMINSHSVRNRTD